VIGLRAMSMPSSVALPAVGLSSVASTLMVELLPAPFGPMNPNTSPRGISNDTPRTASSLPYRTIRLSTLTKDMPRLLPEHPAIDDEAITVLLRLDDHEQPCR